jgi:hypothetical protein
LQKVIGADDVSPCFFSSRMEVGVGKNSHPYRFTSTMW